MSETVVTTDASGSQSSPTLPAGAELVPETGGFFALRDLATDDADFDDDTWRLFHVPTNCRIGDFSQKCIAETVARQLYEFYPVIWSQSIPDEFEQLIPKAVSRWVLHMWRYDRYYCVDFLPLEMIRTLEEFVQLNDYE
jgi:hypothetical protein